jgi:hypothetical protein
MPLYPVRYEMPIPALPASVQAVPPVAPGPIFEAGMLVEAEDDLQTRQAVARLLFGADGFQRWLAEGLDAPFTKVLEVEQPEVDGRQVWPPDGCE